MKEFLSQKGIQYQEYDIQVDDQAREEMLRKTGVMAVPQVAVDGEMVVGFDRNKLEKLLS